MKKATFGLNENIAGALSYAGIFITGIIFLVAEKDNKKVRFHALQSIIWFGAAGIIETLIRLFIGWIPLVGGFVTSVFGIIIFASWIYLIYTAYKGNEFRIPVLGDIVHQTVNK